MRALFTSFPASDYEVSTRCYEQAVGFKVLRDFDGMPHRFKNYDLGGMVLKVYEWTDKYYGSGHSGLFVETVDLDDVVSRIRKFGGQNKTSPVSTGMSCMQQLRTFLNYLSYS